MVLSYLRRKSRYFYSSWDSLYQLEEALSTESFTFLSGRTCVFTPSWLSYASFSAVLGKRFGVLAYLNNVLTPPRCCLFQKLGIFSPMYPFLFFQFTRSLSFIYPWGAKSRSPQYSLLVYCKLSCLQNKRVLTLYSACVTSVARLVYSLDYLNSEDKTYVFQQLGLWRYDRSALRYLNAQLLIAISVSLKLRRSFFVVVCLSCQSFSSYFR